MEKAVLVLLGLAGGVLAGICAAGLIVVLWYDVLRIGDHGDGLSGFSSFIVVALALSGAGAVTSAILMDRRARGVSGRGDSILVVSGVALILLGFVGVFLMGMVV